MIVFGLVVAVLAVVMWIRRTGTGTWHALLVLGVIDALPGKTLEQTSLGGFGATDLLTYILVASLLIDNWRGSLSRRTPLAVRITTLWAAIFVAMCAVAAVRVYLWHNEGPHDWTHVGLGYVAFAVLLPLFAINFRDVQRRDAFVTACGVAAIYVSLTLSVAAVTGASLTVFVHVTNQASQAASSSVTRVYATDIGLVAIAFPFALGFAAFGSSRRLRRFGALVAACCLVAIALSETRALYFGDGLAMAIVTLVWGLGSAASARKLRRKVTVAAVALTFVAVGIAAAGGPNSVASPLAGVISRATQTFSASQTAENDVRLQEAHTLEQILGGNWLFGLGFQGQYYTGLPEWSGGSIQNGDVGVLNVVMALGVVGAILNYLPYVALFLVVTRDRFKRRDQPEAAPLALGAAGFAVAAVGSSLTLALMFYVTSSVACAAALALGISATYPVTRNRPVTRQV
jgi:hypothetical protein